MIATASRHYAASTHVAVGLERKDSSETISLMRDAAKILRVVIERGHVTGKILADAQGMLDKLEGRKPWKWPWLPPSRKRGKSSPSRVSDALVLPS